MQERELRVGIGDMKFTRGTGKIITYALGSCIGISFWDPFLHLGALLHIMLPERHDAEEGNIYKYADSGIHETIRKLSAFGMVKSRTVVKIAGCGVWKYWLQEYFYGKKDTAGREYEDFGRGYRRRLCKDHDIGY